MNVWLAVCGLLLGAFSPGGLRAQEPADPLGGALGNHFAHAAASNSTGTPAGNNLSSSDTPEVEDALAQMEQAALGWEVEPAAPVNRRAFVLLLVLILTGLIAFQMYAPGVARHLNERFNPWAASSAAAACSLARANDEHQALSEFVTTFRTRSETPAGRPDVRRKRDPLKAFFNKTPDLLGQLREPLKKIAAADPQAQQQLLADLLGRVQTLKDEAVHPNVLPVWQMVSALEGLIRQLTGKPANVTASTLRTVAAGVDVLGELCRPRLQPDLLTHPPLRLLAVDDDPICLKAVSMALKKTLGSPDLAEHGEAALALAAQHPYDVIFLDVLMPGMDGFEACTKIHELEPNRATPVVFVTTLNDFDARTKASIKGGADFIGKPFLSFEITVKALTFAVRRRLQSRARTAPVSQPAVNGVEPRCNHATLRGSKTDAGQPARNGHATPGPQPLAQPRTPGASPEKLADDPALETPPDGAAADAAPSPAFTDAFWTRASAQAGSLRELIAAIFETEGDHARQQMLAAFAERLNELLPDASAATGHPAVRLAAGIQGLLQKLLRHPAEITSSTLLTIATAVDLLRELCASGVKSGLTDHPPIRVLAVDDDPVARRAISLALKRTFPQPESAESGEDALALAKEQPFDVIFMDVQMPGMDGFTTCLRIHETELNHGTPVVFVTNHSDFKARSQSNVSGGSDFVAKPFLAAEITLKALTFALRGRLMKQKWAHHLGLPSEMSGATPARREAVPA